eukprot:scaffold11755_cov18-Tisochrysis_lutea.AAC.1
MPTAYLDAHCLLGCLLLTWMPTAYLDAYCSPGGLCKSLQMYIVIRAAVQARLSGVDTDDLRDGRPTDRAWLARAYDFGTVLAHT